MYEVLAMALAASLAPSVSACAQQSSRRLDASEPLTYLIADGEPTGSCSRIYALGLAHTSAFADIVYSFQ